MRVRGISDTVGETVGVFCSQKRRHLQRSFTDDEKKEETSQIQGLVSHILTEGVSYEEPNFLHS